MTFLPKLRPATAGLVLLVTLAACGSDPDPAADGPVDSPTPTASTATSSQRAPKTFAVARDSSGSSVKVIPGDRIEITLDANATTGYSWEYKTKPSAIVREIRATYSPTPHPAGMTGSGGFQYYEYLVEGTGTTSIALTYRGPSGDDGGSFTLTIIST